jgi:putative PEP-CTERM system TPR-repeat lipoprotein
MAAKRWRLAVLYAGLVLAAACTPDPEKLMRDARAAFESGQFRTAEIELKNLLQREPDDAAARLLLARVGLATSDFAGAEQNARRAVQAGIDAASAQVFLVQALIGQRKPDEALEQIASGPALAGPEQVRLLALEGAAQRQRKAYGLSETAYRKALELDPAAADIRTDLAALLLEAGRANDARTLVDEVLAANPTFVPALLLRGNLESASRQYGSAEATFQQAADLEKGNEGRGTSYVLALAQLIEAQLAQNKIAAADSNADALLALDPRSPVARYMKAAVEVQQKNFDGAERRLEGVIADAPQYWPAHRLLGAINLEQNQPGPALTYLRTAVDNNPSDSAARLQLAELYIRQGEVEAARKLMETSSGAAPSDGLLLAFAGRASQQAGLAEQAAQYFDQSERRVPTDVRDLAGMSNMYVAAGEFERAIRVLESASFDDPQSERLTQYLLALVQVRQGNLDAADATAQKLAQQQPDAAWPLNLRGSIAMARADLPRAHELLTRALAVEPNNLGALLNMARVAVAQKNNGEAEQYLQRAAEVAPDNVTARIGLAQLAAARGDFAAAATEISQVPPSPLRDRLTGELMAVQGRFDDAATAFGRAYAAQPSGDLALRAYGAAIRAGRPNADAQLREWTANHPEDAAPNFALGSIAITKGDLDDAIRRFESVLAANPNHAPTLNNLAWLYSQNGDSRALDLAERAHSIEPNNPSIADTLGWLHVQGGSAAVGLPLLAQAAAALPDQAEIRYHWGVALAETGDRAKALETLKASLASSADFDGRDDAAKRVAALEAGTQ